MMGLTKATELSLGGGGGTYGKLMFDNSLEAG